MRTFERRGARRADIGAIGVLLAGVVLTLMVAAVSAAVGLYRWL